MHTNAVNMHAQVLGWVHVITSLKYLSVNLSIMWWPRSWAFEKVPDYFSEYQSQGTKINFLKRHIYFERITDRPCIHSSAGSLDRPAPGQAEVRSLSWVSHTGGKDSSTAAIFHCFPEPLGRSWTRSEVAVQRTSTRTGLAALKAGTHLLSPKIPSCANVTTLATTSVSN